MEAAMTIQDVGPAPCVGCEFYARCRDEKLACRDFINYVRNGPPRPHIPKPGDEEEPEPAPRVPTRETFNKVFKGD